MTEHVDVAVIGMGPGGEVAAGRLLAGGKHVAVIERELIGGECAYWACIPSKSVLRPPEAGSEVDRAAGVDGARLDWPAARNYRDSMARHLDDASQVDSYADQGAMVVKGEARITGPGRVQVGDRELTADHLVVATGSAADVPPIDGLDQVSVWTNREVYTTEELPRRAVVVGGSAVGVETGLFLSRFGTDVTIVQRGERLLGREEPRVGELVAGHLAEAGVEVRTSTSPARARRDGADSVLELDDGTEVRGDVIVFGTGRSPRTSSLGLEHAGVSLGDHGEVLVDDHCRAADGVWAVGDVTGIMPFTHVAKYQGGSWPTPSSGNPAPPPTAASPAWSSPTPRSPPPVSPEPRPPSRVWTWRAPSSTSPKHSPDRGPMNENLVAISACSRTASKGC
jgi:pyruvate/2-oxoglutarate dehydrogenase complex dihydrolipoamide dehydrogenase (E3) component